MKKPSILLFTIFCCILCCTNNSHKPKSYKPNWESLAHHDAAPEWFVDSKLGIYFTWGPYTVPAHATEWYPRFMFDENSPVMAYHEQNYGKVTEFGYHDFIPMFKAQHFDPEAWASLFQQAGAKFAGPIAEHHDGFSMWNSKINPWNVVSMGPKRDILGELFQSLRKRELKTIATFHHARNGQRNANKPKNWKIGYDSHYPYHPNWPTASTDPKLRMLYGNFPTEDAFNNYWLDKVNEVVDNYDPDIIWFDSWLNLIPQTYRQAMAAHFFNNALVSGKAVVTCHKQNDMPMDFSVLDFEQGGRREIHPMPWMTDITISNYSWSYVEGQTYKTPALIIRNMIDVWSKNGIVLLNISPRADGVIPMAQKTVLKEIGAWLKVHGEAVYGTRPFTIYGYGTAAAADGKHGGQSSTVAYTENDVRFTVSKDKKNLYFFFLGKPKTGEVIRVKSLGKHRYPTFTPVKNITILGSGEAVEWELTTNEFLLKLPHVELNDIATVLKFQLE